MRDWFRIKNQSFRRMIWEMWRWSIGFVGLPEGNKGFGFRDSDGFAAAAAAAALEDEEAKPPLMSRFVSGRE